MPVSRRLLLGGAAALSAAPIMRARAQGKPSIKLGVLTDLSGTYRDNTGPTSVAAAQQAIDEMKPHLSFDVELISADHQNKPDVASTIARQWYDQGVAATIDVPTSSVALAVQGVTREKNKIFLASGPATTALTGEQCSPNFVHWTYDTYMLAKSTGGAMVKAGGDSWYFLTADYAFGKQL